MSYEYAISRVRDALEKSEGNQLKAHRLLMTWLEKDQSLFFGIAAPHINSLLSYAIGQAAQPEKKPMPEKLNLSEEETGEFSEVFLESLQGGRNTGSGVGFGETAPRGAVNPPAQASKAHIDAITQIAQAGEAKGKPRKS